MPHKTLHTSISRSANSRGVGGKAGLIPKGLNLKAQNGGQGGRYFTQRKIRGEGEDTASRTGPIVRIPGEPPSEILRFGPTLLAVSSLALIIFLGKKYRPA